MNKILLITVAVVSICFTACKKKDFEDSYADPGKVSTSTVEKQYSGMLVTRMWTNTDKGNHGYVVPQYWNYFVILRTTLLHYTQAVGWENSDNQYIPGAASIGDNWKDYYYFLAQYRELQTIYSKMIASDQAAYRIYMIAAAIFVYDQTQKMIDLHGDIPFSEAGMLSVNNGNYTASAAKYDDAATIYTTMLDSLKGFSDELNTINVPDYIQKKFTTQDLINQGSVTLWKKYCNSLRLRMLTRVSGASAFTARASSEMLTILSTPTKYPVVTANSENIKVSVYDLSSDITAKSFKDGLEGDAGRISNVAGKVMIDHMNSNGDPRLRAMFEPGLKAGGVYKGIDPLGDRSAQNSAINRDSTTAIYNRSTISRNQYFPGIVMNAAEVSFLTAEYYLKTANLTAAKNAYETGIRQSVEYYYWFRTLSNNNTAPALTPTNATEVDAYIASTGVNWDLALTTNDKLKLIATQKWIHYSVVQPHESWAEIRRLDAPALS
ncbi:MAG TPA: SusD/RagB family nutrient-binding outer membrane lipoprotein, partial [Niastella sp.]